MTTYHNSMQRDIHTMLANAVNFLLSWVYIVEEQKTASDQASMYTSL